MVASVVPNAEAGLKNVNHIVVGQVAASWALDARKENLQNPLKKSENTRLQQARRMKGRTSVSLFRVSLLQSKTLQL